VRAPINLDLSTPTLTLAKPLAIITTMKKLLIIISIFIISCTSEEEITLENNNIEQNIKEDENDIKEPSENNQVTEESNNNEESTNNEDSIDSSGNDTNTESDIEQNDDNKDSTNDDNEKVPNGHYLIKYLERSDCETDLQKQTNISIKIYSTNFYYTSSKKLIKDLQPNENGFYHAQLENGFYFFEVFDTNQKIISYGIYRIPEDLSNNTMMLSKGVLTGIVISDKSHNKIPNTKITFTNENTNEQTIVYSDNSGNVCAKLNPGRHHVRAEHDNYGIMDTEHGFYIVQPNTKSTANYRLMNE